MTKEGIWTIDEKKESKILRKNLADYDFNKFSKKETNDLIRRMREAMKKANGVGLSANQIGLDLNVFVAQVENKFYAIFNPLIVARSEKKSIVEEGCLSIPEIFGNVSRSEKIILEGCDKNDKKIKIKAWGLLARVFQHEYDHLNGKIFTDRTKDLRKYKNVRNYENKEGI